MGINFRGFNNSQFHRMRELVDSGPHEWWNMLSQILLRWAFDYNNEIHEKWSTRDTNETSVYTKHVYAPRVPFPWYFSESTVYIYIQLLTYTCTGLAHWGNISIYRFVLLAITRYLTSVLLLKIARHFTDVLVLAQSIIAILQLFLLNRCDNHAIASCHYMVNSI